MAEETPDQVEPMEQVTQEPQEADTTEETNEAVEESNKTEEEDPRVAELEKKFEDRYTEKDPAFKAVLESKEASPPVVPNYGGRYECFIFLVFASCLYCMCLWWGRTVLNESRIRLF